MFDDDELEVIRIALAQATQPGAFGGIDEHTNVGAYIIGKFRTVLGRIDEYLADVENGDV